MCSMNVLDFNKNQTFRQVYFFKRSNLIANLGYLLVLLEIVMSFMYVRIHFGPSSWPPVHKPHRLAGVRNRLRRIGYRVDLEPIDAYQYCGFEMCGYLVFRCNINNLQFNMTWKQDPVARRAIGAVLKASEDFSRARTHLWARSMIEDAIFTRNEYSCIDYWPTEDIPPFTPECELCTRKDELLGIGECISDTERVCLCVCLCKDSKRVEECACDETSCSCEEIECQCNKVCTCDEKNKRQRVCACPGEKKDLKEDFACDEISCSCEEIGCKCDEEVCTGEEKKKRKNLSKEKKDPKEGVQDFPCNKIACSCEEIKCKCNEVCTYEEKNKDSKESVNEDQ